jgi:hypothetical protein
VISYNPEDAVTTWPDGEYQATIESVVPKISKAGEAKGLTTCNMHEVILVVYPVGEGPNQKVWDYISYPKGTWKLEQLAEALGELTAFKAQKFDIETKVGQNVAVYLRTKTDSFGSKNIVGEYLPTTKQGFKAASKVTSDEAIDPDIPF